VGRTLSIVLGTILLATVTAGMTSAQAATTTSAIPIPATGTYLGAHVDTSANSEQTDVTTLETAMGRRLDMDSHYYSWSSTFPSRLDTWDVQAGRIPLDSWNGVTSAAINNGSQDALIRARATAARTFGAPFLVRLLPEMDAIVKTSTTGTPAQFISAWKHVVNIFRAQGATNVGWVWNPNAFHFSGGVSQRYYPGATYVDWIAADGYNWSPKTPSGTTTTAWTTFHDEFAAFYSWAQYQGKPLMVAETGAMEYPGMTTRKAQWITGTGSTIQASYPKIKALVYFDDIGGSNQSGTQFDWRLNSSAASLNAWVALGRLSWFHPAH
jgi:endoglucanase